MGVFRLETFLHKDIPNDYCWEASVKDLAEEYKKGTGREPVLLADGSSCLRRIYGNKGADWIMGGQMQAFVESMNNFVTAFQNIGVSVVFFFDGSTQEQKRYIWTLRRKKQIKIVCKLFSNLNNKSDDKSLYFRYLLPPLIGATGRFVAKFMCGCDVRMSISKCDAEMADFARQEDCFAILSRDTDFVLLQGARHYLSVEQLDMKTMRTVTYSREGLTRSLGLTPKQLLLLATLLGNGTVSFHKLQNFHKNFSQAGDIFVILPRVVEYIKEWYCTDGHEEEDLREIARDVFGDESMACDLSAGIKSYLPLSTGGDGAAALNEVQGDDWDQVLVLARNKHRSCEVTTHMYPVMLGNAYDLSVCLEDYSSGNLVPTARIYRPLRQRIYGVLLHEKAGTTSVKELCIESMTVPTELSEVPIIKIHDIERFHPGLLKLWDKHCSPNIRWRLFAQSLTQGKTKLDAEGLMKLGLPYAVPVAVLFYLLNEHAELLKEVDVDVILSQAALVRTYSLQDLNAIKCHQLESNVIHLSTIFARGVTTVLFLLSACGFELREAMPSYYFDGKLYQQKYVQMKRGAKPQQLCEYKEDVIKKFNEMKKLVLPPTSWR